MTDEDNRSDNFAGPDGFSAMTFNLRFGLADDGPNSWDHRKKALPALFNKHQPDFIGLQECNDFQIDFLADILAGYGYIGKFSPAPPDWQSNVTFFKRDWEPTGRRHLFLSKTPAVPSKFRGSRWPRQCTIGVFKNNHRRVIVVNTHFDFAEKVQIQSAVLIMERLTELPSDLPAVLLGDFNATPAQDCYEVFTGRSERFPLKACGLKNAAKKPLMGTYHGFEGQTDGDHIDWILYRGHLAPASYEVVTTTFEGVYPSDHFPVYVEFKWIDPGFSSSGRKK